MLSERLKQYRRNHGLTQKELADALKTGQSTISQYEDGSRTPGVKRLYAIASLMGCTVDDLLREEAG